jgi:hypothetical protein
MFKLLINSPSGEQKIERVHETGAYFDSIRVIWDERIDGTMPAVTLGKMQRVGNILNTLADFIPAHAAFTAARQVESDAEARVETIEQSARQDATITSLKTMTNQQLDTWFDDNITTLASARALLKILFKLIIKKAV